jgi:hypothetical protein
MSKEPTTLKNIIINLKIISKLQPHVRLDTSGILFKIYNSTGYLPVWAVRWWAVHNRKQDLSRVALLFEETFTYITDGGKDPQIMTALKDSIVGLKNLKTTYEEDITSVSSIEYIIDKLGTFKIV